MEFILFIWDVVVHLDTHLAALLQQHGTWVYLLLFVIIFCETGLVVTPFLPGDSLLFVAGALWATAGMDAAALCVTLAAAGAHLRAVCGRDRKNGVPAVPAVQHRRRNAVGRGAGLSRSLLRQLGRCEAEPDDCDLRHHRSVAVAARNRVPAAPAQESLRARYKLLQCRERRARQRRIPCEVALDAAKHGVRHPVLVGVIV